jgi:VWFA-related protein
MLSFARPTMRPPPILVGLLVCFATSLAPACAQQGLAAQSPTIHTQSRIVVVDVVVTDSKGQPIHGLKQSDFKLLEDNQTQNIRHFDENAAVPLDTHHTPQPMMAPNTFTNFINTPTGSALNVVLLDTLNTPQESQPFLRSQLKTVAEMLPEGSRVAIFGLTTKLVMLQSFTSDPAILKAALTQPRRMSSATSLQAKSTPELSASDQTLIMTAGGYEAAPFDPNSPLANFERKFTLNELSTRVELTLSALTQIGQYLAAIPGRKNLIWISGSFPITFILDLNSAGRNFFDNSADFSNEIAKVSAELARSQVAIYPVDSRGIQADAAYTAALETRTRGAVANDPHYNSRMSSSLATSLVLEHGSMDQLADQTGGHAFYGINNIASAVTKAINLGANYYTLTYVPSNTNWNGDTRRIKVTLDGKRYQLAYRTGYIASDRPTTASNQQTTAESSRTTASTVTATMQRGAPNPTEILFKILVTPSTVINPPASGPRTVATDGKLGTVSLHAQRRYHIDYAVDPEDIHWELDHGVRSASIEFMIVGYDNDGTTINSADRIVPIHLTGQDYDAATHGGLRLGQEIAMPAKGEFYLRIGVLDKSTNRIGAVEVSTVTLHFPKP